MEQKIITELSEKYNKREELINALITENIKEGFPIIESKDIIEEFYKNINGVQMGSI